MIPATKLCSTYCNRWPLCALECVERGGVWPATLEFFGPDERNTDGLRSECRACREAAAEAAEVSGEGGQTRTD
jgi:hypothetical protein